MNETIIEVKNLSKHFPIKGGFFNRQIASVKALNPTSFKIRKGECLGLVGESGCGKSTLGRCILRLIEPSSGDIFFKGQNITKYSFAQLKEVRRKMQIIFQDPYASLNPRMTVNSILNEPLEIHKLHTSKKERNRRLHQLLDYVQLTPEALNKYPHEFSGGQRQRICIARALAVEPEFIVCDEPVSALDVSVQAQVINLMMDLQQDLDLTYLFIAHDLKVVEYISNKVSVMYMGNIVESGTAQELYTNPKHPYTQALISAIPVPNPEHKSDRIILQGDVPSPINPPNGCHFHPRCHKVMERCHNCYPDIKTISESHNYACYL